nr:hypothetical protein [Pseudomonadota bacterium]
METFSISDAAFTGFRIVRERPKAVAVWAAIQLVASLVLGGMVVAIAGPEIRRVTDISAVMNASPSETMVLVQQMAPIYALFFTYTLVFDAVIYAAMNRAVMSPADDRFGYFRLGADELRQFALLLLSFVLFMGVYFVAALVAVALAVIASLVLKSVAALVAVLAIVAAICAAIFILVRLSLASAQTFATRRVILFGSWALTRGRFWPIFGTYVLAFAFACVVLVLGFVVSFALAAIVGGGEAMAKMVRPDFSALATMFSPALLARMVVS